MVRGRLEEIAAAFGGSVSGRGFIQGLRLPDNALAGAASRAAFERGLVIETAGAHDEVLKFLAPLTTPESELNRGLDIIEASVKAAVAGQSYS